MTLIAALLLAAAQPPAQSQGAPPLDPHCPRGDLNRTREAGRPCIGRLTRRYAFAVTYPQAAAEIPPLFRQIRAQAAADEASLRREADAAWARRQRDGGEPPLFSPDQAWEVDAALPELVAASAAATIYTGGAHEGIGYRVILLDRRTGRRLALQDLFASPRGMRALARAFCHALTNEFRVRRDDQAAMPRCPAPAGQPVTLVCGERGRIDSLRALLNPYVVGSWAEGPYEIDFPVTAEMLAALKPRYRPAFALRREARAMPLDERCSERRGS
jgi:hypothetical protein